MVFVRRNSWDALDYYWWIFVVQLIFMTIFVRGLIFLLKEPNRTRGSHEIVLYLFTLPLFLLIISNFGQQGYIERSVITALPFFFIVIASGATAFKNKIVRYAGILTIFIVSFATVAVYYTRQDVWTVYKPNADWRAAAAYLKDEMNAAPAVPEIFTVTPADELPYYNPLFKQVLHKELEFSAPNRELEDNFWGVNEIEKDHVPKIYEKMVRDKKERFYLVNNNYWERASQEISDKLRGDPRFLFRATQSFKGVDIYCFDLAK